jgi:HEAT repeat protein
VLATRLAQGSTSVTREELLAALLARATEESSPRVRAAALAALRGANEPAARTLLASAAEKDPDAVARVAALEALAALGEDAERAALAERVYEQRFSWDTQAAALELSTRADPAGAWSALERAYAQPSPHDRLAAKTLALMMKSGDARAPGVCRSAALDRARPAPFRSAAVAALASAPAQDPENTRVLEQLLVDPAWSVRRGAIEALAKSHDAGVRHALAERWKQATLPRERRAIEAAFQKPAAP